MKNYLFIAVIAISFFSCNNDTNDTDIIDEDANVAANDATGLNILFEDNLTLTEIKSEEDYENVTLNLVKPNLNKFIPEDAIPFEFTTENFEVGKQGNINFSLNNALVKSYPSNNFSRNLPEGEFLFTSFLVDTKGISLKSKNSAMLKQIKIGKGPKENLGFKKDSSHLVYNLPQGIYKGEATKNVILDFVLINTKLSEKGKRVKVLINGTEFILNSWKSYLVEGLPMGKNVFKVELVNDLGVIPGPFNRGEERVITLVE